MGREPTLEELAGMIERNARSNVMTSDLKVVRVVVYENPFATIPLPRTIFVGPYDERWAQYEDGIARVFVGAEMERLDQMITTLK